jgi:uncharacterized metal-binding protein YceD (DUF177 family)
MEQSNSPEVEFSRPIPVEQIGVQETVRQIVANASERVRLAERFGLIALDRLQATLQLQRIPGGLIRVRGHLEADVVQSCVVTLEPVPAQLSESFTMNFVSGRADRGGEVVISVDEEEPPETIAEGRIDLGETVAQQLAVSLDPYPRSGQAPTLNEGEPEIAGQNDKKRGPFAVLEGWRDRKGGK